MEKRIEDKLDKLSADIEEIKETLAKNTTQLAVNTTQLEIHIEGVKLAREQNNILKKDMDDKLEIIKADLLPIKAHVAFVKGAMWALGIVGAVTLGLQQMGILQKLF